MPYNENNGRNYSFNVSSYPADDPYSINESQSSMIFSKTNVVNPMQKRHHSVTSNVNFSPRKHLDIDRLVLFKRGMTIKDDYYITEISYNQRGLFVSLYSIENPDKNKILEIDNLDKCT